MNKNPTKQGPKPQRKPDDPRRTERAGDFTRLSRPGVFIGDVRRHIGGLVAIVAAGLDTKFGKASLAAVGLATLLLALTALEARAPATPVPVTRASGSPSDALLARVGDRNIFLSDLVMLARAKEAPTDANLSTDSAEIQRLLEESIDQYLLSRRAIELGLHDTLDIRVRLRAARERILASAFLEREVADRVPPDTVTSIYDAQNQILTLGDEVRARLIATPSRDAIDEIALALEGGQSFASLARDRSADGDSGRRGGDLGYFTKEAMTARSPEIAAAAFDTKVGAISRPFQSSAGWSIVFVEDRRPVQPPEFHEIQGDIEYFLTLEAVREIIDELRRGVDVEIFSAAALRGAEAIPAIDASAGDGDDDGGGG